MARLNLNYAVAALQRLEVERPEAHAAVCLELGLDPSEPDAWARAARAMHIPHDPVRDITPQDDTFLSREPWDLDRTPPDKFPLLLHYHPLAIYRHQVLKQADVVMAMFLLGQRVHARAEASELRVLRPAHHRGLVAVGEHPEHRRRGDRQLRRRDPLLRLRPPDGPGRRRRQRLGRRPRRVLSRCLDGVGVRVRRRPRLRRRPLDRPAPASPMAVAQHPDPVPGPAAADHPHPRRGALRPGGRSRRSRSPCAARVGRSPSTSPSCSPPASTSTAQQILDP